MCISKLGFTSGEARKFLSAGGGGGGGIRVLLAFGSTMGSRNGPDEVFYHTKPILKSKFSRGASDKFFV